MMTRFPVIKVEDSRESLVHAIHEMHETLKKGGGVGFDLTGIQSKSKQDEIRKRLNEEADKLMMNTKRTVADAWSVPCE